MLWNIFSERFGENYNYAEVALYLMQKYSFLLRKHILPPF